MTGTRTRGGFVFQAVEGVRTLFENPPTGTAADYVPALTRRLFDGVLGYDDIAYSQRNDWESVTFVDDDGQPAVVLTATGVGEDIRGARRRAVAALETEPSARYAVATNRDEMVVLARCSPDHPDATERDGIAIRTLTEIGVRAAVERSAGRSLAEALTPDQQLSFAKLTALQRDAVSAARDDPDADDPEPTLGDLTASSPSHETTPETLADTLTETLEDVLRPAVSDAFGRLSHRIQAFADRESTLEERIEEAKAAGDEVAVTDLRADLFDLREQYATARRLEAGFARWRRVAADGSEAEAAEAFVAESAAVALDTLLLARVAADRGLAGDLGAYREFWADEAEHAHRDAADMVQVVREELSGVSEDATDDGTFAWVFEAGIADAFADAVAALEAVDVGDLDARELTEAFDGHLGADARPVRGATRPSTAGLLLDRAGYTPDAAIDDAGSDLLDPACGDGSLLVGAADRLLARLDRTDATPAETLEAVRDRLHGFDVHPYAVHLAESRLLLRTVDVHADAAVADGSFSLGRFGVHRTDALRDERGGRFAGTAGGRRARRREQAADVKARDGFGFVVSDPPNGPVEEPPETDWNAAAGADWSALFLERTGHWLADGGRLSMAVDGSLLDDEAAAGTRSRLATGFRMRELIEFDTGGGAAPLFVAAERVDSGAESDSFTYARVTPTFLDLVREGLIRPGSGEETTPAELVSRCLPGSAGGDPPSMETVLVELGLVCDATVDGPMPVEVQSVDGDRLAEGAWAFGADSAAAAEESISPLDGQTTDEPDIGSPRSRVEK
ncbi:hypothetical protein [Halolamina salifodinae]|uniref:N-6 DNA Methylase n=1 Tax=Halolamina salifodinae TaxID=1202767 RepID=A0A8T4H1U5_9EURY|nr:hypothetical protein [Halolamina salifodinae]MBP1987575.1 hypothetical protein [Halolamina salifodinae]